MRLIFLSLFVVALMSTTSLSGIIIVNNASDLQTAINNAADGDVIKVQNGNAVNIFFQNKNNIVIESYNALAPITLLQGTSGSYIINMRDCHNISIKNINFALNDNVTGISFFNSSYIKIIGCTIWGQYMINNNIGIQNYGMHTTITDCTIGGYLSNGVIGDRVGFNDLKIFDSDLSGNNPLRIYTYSGPFSFENSTFLGIENAMYINSVTMVNIKANQIQGGTYDINSTWGTIYSSLNTFSNPPKNLFVTSNYYELN